MFKNSKENLDRVFYPKYWFVAIVTFVVLLVTAADFWLYKEYYDKQEVLINETIESKAQAINYDLLAIESKLLQFTKHYFLEDLHNKSSDDIFNILDLGTLSSLISKKIKLIEDKSLSRVMLNGAEKPVAISKTLVLEDNKLYIVFKTNILSTKSSSKQRVTSKAIELFVDIKELVSFHLHNDYESFYLRFAFRYYNESNIIDYIFKYQDQAIIFVDEQMMTSLKDNGNNLIRKINILGNQDWRLESYLKIAMLQGFIWWLVKTSLFVLVVALVLANYIYRKFYYLEWQKLSITKDKKIFQQRAEITLDTIQEGVIITNSTSQIIYANHIIEKYFDTKLLNIYFKTLDDLIPELSLVKDISREHIKLSDVEIIIQNEKYYFDLQAAKLFDDDKMYLGLAVFLHDITQKKQAQEKINYLAYYDETTKLPNRVSLVEHYKKLLAQDGLLENPSYKLFSIVVNVINLRNINDTIGYENRQRVLSVIISTITEYLDGYQFADDIYRIGDESFIVTLIFEQHKHGKSSMLFVTNFMNNLIAELIKPINIDEQNIYMQYSFGISVFPDNFDLYSEEVEPYKLLRYAEIAMSAARKKGLNKYIFYSEDINISIKEKFTLENELRSAIRENKLELLFHPQIDLNTDKLRGFEVLVRWQRDNGDMVSPNTFIPLLEKSGLIVTVGDWILREACLQGLKIIGEGINFETLSVNVSGLQLQSEGFIERLKKIIKETSFPRDKLELEVTESILLDNAEKTIDILGELRNEGVCIALDDFGTGFSSLNYLKDLPLDYLKIDRSFVKSINSGDTRLLEAIIAIAKTMNLTTIAEGVETEKQVNFLRDHLCDIIQGYYISKPITLEVVLANFKES